MKDSTLIADLVRAGLDAELLARVVNEIMAASVRDNVRDTVREYERVRKQTQRKTGGKQTMSAPFEPVIVPESVPDNAKDRPSLTSFLPTLAAETGSKREVVSGRSRGTSLPADWRMSMADRAVAIELGMSEREITEFEVEFRDYWIAIPGARGRKCDWPATVRNRLREVAKRRRKINGKSNATMDAFDDLIARTGGAVEGDPPMRDITPRGGHVG